MILGEIRTYIRYIFGLVIKWIVSILLFLFTKIEKEILRYFKRISKNVNYLNINCHLVLLLFSAFKILVIHSQIETRPKVSSTKNDSKRTFLWSNPFFFIILRNFLEKILFDACWVPFGASNIYSIETYERK